MTDKEAAEEYVRSLYPESGRELFEGDVAYEAFLAGVEWARKNPERT